MKQCSVCGETKPRDQFYKHKAHADGLRSECKQCVHPKCLTIEERKRFWAKKQRTAMVKRPDAIRAKDAVAHKIRSGDITKPETCAICRHHVQPSQLQGHHEDYSKPLDVMWCCKACHNLIHRYKKATEGLQCQKPL